MTEARSGAPKRVSEPSPGDHRGGARRQATRGAYRAGARRRKPLPGPSTSIPVSSSSQGGRATLGCREEPGWRTKRSGHRS